MPRHGDESGSAQAARAGAITVPYEELSAEALIGVVEAFVLREGTDYGVREYSIAEKVEHVMAQLRRGEAQILFDEESESVTIAVTRRK